MRTPAGAASDKIAKLYAAGSTIDELRRRFNCGHRCIMRVLESRGVARRRPGYNNTVEFIPTPEYIKQQTAVIGSRWTEAERRRRAGEPDEVECLTASYGPRHNGRWIFGL